LWFFMVVAVVWWVVVVGGGVESEDERVNGGANHEPQFCPMAELRQRTPKRTSAAERVILGVDLPAAENRCHHTYQT
jgi:hypothetical protein